MITMFGTLARSIAGIALAAALLGGGTEAASAQSSSITIWVGSWWEPQVPVAKELWAKDHPDIALNIQPLPINGYLDKFEVSKIRGFENGLLSLLRTKHNDILDDVRKSGDLSSDTEKKLKSAVDGFAKTFS